MDNQGIKDPDLAHRYPAPEVNLVMKQSNLVTFREYIIDTKEMRYKAVWNCQVAWTDECIYYDAETGRLVIKGSRPEFVCEHALRVTKSEYRHHVEEAKKLPQVSEKELKALKKGKNP